MVDYCRYGRQRFFFLKSRKKYGRKSMDKKTKNSCLRILNFGWAIIFLVISCLLSAATATERPQLRKTKADQIVYSIDGTDVAGEKWGKILVLVNGNIAEAVTFSLSEGKWTAVQFTIGLPRKGRIYSGSVEVKPISGMVLYSESTIAE